MKTSVVIYFVLVLDHISFKYLEENESKYVAKWFPGTSSVFLLFYLMMNEGLLLLGCHTTQHNDIQQNDTQNNVMLSARMSL